MVITHLSIKVASNQCPYSPTINKNILGLVLQIFFVNLKAFESYESDSKSNLPITYLIDRDGKAFHASFQYNFMYVGKFVRLLSHSLLRYSMSNLTSDDRYF